MPGFLAPIVIPTDPGTGSDGGSTPPPVQTTQKQFILNGVSSYTASHNFVGRPRVLLLNAAGDEVETDVTHGSGQVYLHFPRPFTGVLYLG